MIPVLPRFGAGFSVAFVACLRNRALSAGFTFFAIIRYVAAENSAAMTISYRRPRRGEKLPLACQPPWLLVPFITVPLTPAVRGFFTTPFPGAPTLGFGSPFIIPEFRSVPRRNAVRLVPLGVEIGP